VMSERSLRTLSDWKPSLAVDLDGRKVLLVHGSLEDPFGGYIYPENDLRQFENADVCAVFMGHTHRPFILRKGKTLILNAGSCGLPREEGGLLSCGVYDTATGAAEIYRISVDTEELVAHYGDRLHRDVVACMRRKSPERVFGVVVE
jgi:predicted phosphodiesterase